MKYRIAFVAIAALLVLLVCLQIAAKAQAGTATGAGRFVSPWTEIPPQSITVFEHNLGTRPLELFVWVAPYLKARPPAFIVAVPYADSADKILVESVDNYTISIQNRSTNAVWIQIVASP